MLDLQADFQMNDHKDEVMINIRTSSGDKLQAQDILDAVVELLMYEYGVLPRLEKELRN